MHTSAHLYGAFRERLDAFGLELDRVAAGDVEALHRMRVASRRLRELLPLLALDHDVTRTLSRRLRKVTRQLGTVREPDVLLLLVGELAEDRRFSSAALWPIGAAASKARLSARASLSATLPTVKLKRLVHELERAAKSLQSRHAKPGHVDANGRGRASLWALEARLVHRAARVREAVETAGTVYVPEHLHRVRIAVKKLRYTAEVAADATRTQIAADVAALKNAQDLLGRLHDLGVLLLRAREAQAQLFPPDLIAWRDLSVLVDIVEDDCRRLHARYMRNRTELMVIANRMAVGPRTQPVGRRAAV
jgi:CHAD domain-containing protein